LSEVEIGTRGAGPSSEAEIGSRAVGTLERGEDWMRRRKPSLDGSVRFDGRGRPWALREFYPLSARGSLGVISVSRG
jgi:hypothetical protein